MSDELNITTGIRGLARFQSGVKVATAISQRWKSYAERRASSRAAAQLRSWSDSQLKDIGISRCEIQFAVRDTDRRSGQYRHSH